MNATAERMLELVGQRTRAEVDAVRAELKDTRAELAALRALHEATVARLTALERTPGPPGPQGERGQDGRDGRDGRDGVASVDELERRFQAEQARADARMDERMPVVADEAVAKLPTPRYRGVWVEGTEYKAGECVSYGGSTWIATASTSERPGEGRTAWQLAVKRGRDGRDAKAAK